MKTRVEIVTIDGLNDLMLTNQRPKRVGQHMIELVTDGFFRTIQDNEYKQQRVQTTTWDKYQIQVLATEDNSIELLKTAKLVTVTIYESSLVHNAVILSVDRSSAGDSDFSLITIEYYDTRLFNYPFGKQPIYNYLRSDAIAENYSFSQMVILRVSFKHPQEGETSTFDFNTLLIPVDSAKAPELSAFNNTQQGLSVSTNTVIKKQWVGTFYLNGEDAANFLSVVPLADGWSVSAYLYSGNVGREAAEPSEISVEQLSGSDIYKATINLVYESINHYSYGTN